MKFELITTLSFRELGALLEMLSKQINMFSHSCTQLMYSDLPGSNLGVRLQVRKP